MRALISQKLSYSQKLKLNVEIKAFSTTIYIFDSDFVWRMKLMIIKGKKFVLCV